MVETLFFGFLESQRGFAVKKNGGYVQIDFSQMMDYSAVLAETISEKFFEYVDVLNKVLTHHVSDYEDSHTNARFFVSFFNVNRHESLRDLRAENMGVLTKISGRVTKTVGVRSKLVQASYTCVLCHQIIQLDTENVFLKPRVCANLLCKNVSSFLFAQHTSKFCDFQTITIQECEEEFTRRRNSTPKTLKLFLHHDLVLAAKPGVVYDFIGAVTNIPILKRGRLDAAIENRSEFNEHTHTMAFEVNNVCDSDHRFSEDPSMFSPGQYLIERFETMSKTPSLFEKMSNSLFPSIFGHLKVKQAILLLLLGGVKKKTEEGLVWFSFQCKTKLIYV